MMKRLEPQVKTTAPALTLATLLVLALAGCAQITPDMHPQARRDIASAELSAGIKLAHEGWPEAQWWTAYHDQQLNALIKQALADGPSLEVAAAHIGSARSALSRSAADLGVDVSAYANANRQRYSGTGLFPAPIGGTYFTAETLRLDARYNFDWWGKNRAQVAAAVGELNAGRAEYAEAEQSLAAAIAQSYFRLQGAWARLANTEQLAATQAALVQDKARRIARGLANADEQRAAESELSLIRKQQAVLKTDIEHEREALRALAGAGNSALADLKPVALTPAPHALPAHQAIKHPGAVGKAFDQAGLAHQFEMARNARLTLAENIDQFHDRELFAGQQTQQAQARRFAGSFQRFKQGIEIGLCHIII